MGAEDSSFEGAPKEIAMLRMTAADLEPFALASGDRNPLHLSVSSSNASAFGERVAFGILSVVECLRRAPRRLDEAIARLDVTFLGPMLLDVAYEVRRLGGPGEPSDRVRFEVLDGCRVVLRLEARFESRREPSVQVAFEATALRSDAAIREADQVRKGDGVTGTYVPSGFAEWFARSGLPQRGVDALAALAMLNTSYVIGMELPGERAVFTSLSLVFEAGGPTDTGVPRFAATVLDAGSDSSIVSLDWRFERGRRGVARGVLKAFVRRSVRAAPLAVLAAKLPSHFRAAFSGKAAIVTGGARGLGREIVRALALSGCRVVFGYRTSSASAEELTRELAAAPGCAVALQGDAGTPQWCEQASRTVEARFGRLDLLVCTAARSPALLDFSVGVAARAVDHLAGSVAADMTPMSRLLPALDAAHGALVYASSQFVVQTAPLFQYVAAKAAGEALVRWAADHFRHTSFLVLRLPRLATEMNNTPLAWEGAVAPDEAAVATLAALARGIEPATVVVESQVGTTRLQAPPRSTLPRADEVEHAESGRSRGEVLADIAVLGGDLAAIERAMAVNGRPAAVTEARRGATGSEDIEAVLLRALNEARPGTDEVRDTSASFRRLGVSSMELVDFLATAGRGCGVALTVADAFAHPSIAALARHVMDLSRDGREAAMAADRPSVTVDATPYAGPAPVGPGSDDVAIVGVACRVAGANDAQTFWDKLVGGVESIGDFPRERRSWRGRTLQAPPRGGFVAGIDMFDHAFFGIAPREAESMDPQHRLFLEEAYRALEDAGLASLPLGGRPCGVYVGCGGSDYALRLEDAGCKHDSYSLTGTMGSIAAARIAYFLDLRGPALTIDTACSSSLSALHLACEDLRRGVCEMAIAGGVTLLTTDAFFAMASDAGMLSPTGKCRAFDRDADGIVAGEGVGVVVLKPLSRAVADGDRVYAVLKASGYNQDGRTNGITAPNPAAQRALLSDVYARFGIDPRTIGYVEAHGTGTKLGDPVEILALAQVFAGGAPGTCALGSVKTNIGHALAASGILGVIKSALCLWHARLVPSLHFEHENDLAPLEGTPFYIPTAAADWCSAVPRRAAVSSFGFSGTNVHVVLEQATSSSAGAPRTTGHACVLLLSGPTDEIVRTRAAELAAWWDGKETIPLEDLAYTLQNGRTHFACRAATVVDSRGAAVASLQRLAQGDAQGWHVSGSSNASRGIRLAMTELARRTVHEADPSGPGQGHALDLLADLYAHGCDIPWAALWRERRPHVQLLPPYPFARARFWPVAADAPSGATPGQAAWREVPERRGPIHAPSGGSASENAAAVGDPGIAAIVLTEAAAVLRTGTRSVDVRRGVFEIGFDSITLTELCARLTRRLGWEVTPDLFLEYSTLSGFSRHVERVSAARPALAAPAPTTDHIAERRTARATGHERVSRDATIDPIAIVGIGGAMPGSPDLRAFWRGLVERRSFVTEVPADRWDWRRSRDRLGTDVAAEGLRWGSFLDGIDRFDPLFFGISPREAEMMDPQQRLILEAAWHAIEDSGHDPCELAGSRTGVFVGVAAPSYAELIHERRLTMQPHTSTGMSSAIVANRVSYVLDLRGPSESIDTACSASLVALHRAIRSMREGACDGAIVGGVNVMVTPTVHLAAARTGMLSPDGRCYTFDDRANGYVRGEGVGVVVLKPLSRAERDGDSIYAILRGSAEGHGGRGSSLTAPNTASQVDLLVRAYLDAGVDAATITYVEAHGTGTALGDPAEANALKKAFAELAALGGTPAMPRRCGLGSVKANVGHLETAAGIAAVLKVVLAMKHGVLPGHPTLETANRYLQLDDTPFYLLRETQPWPRLPAGDGRELPRRAGVSSFGFGGANAHVVLEEYIDPRPRARDSAQVQVVPLSARDEGALIRGARALRDVLLGDAPSLEEVCFSLRAGRTAFDERVAFVVSSADELGRALDAFASGDANVPGMYRGRATEVDGGPVATSDARELAASWVRGAGVAWIGLDDRASPRRCSLPGYSSSRIRCWLPDGPAAGSPPLSTLPSPEGAGGITEGEHTFRLARTHALVADHRVLGVPTLPAAGHMLIVAGALRAQGLAGPLRFRRVVWMRPLSVHGEAIDVKVGLKQTDGGFAFEVRADTDPSPYSTGWLGRGDDHRATEEDIAPPSQVPADRADRLDRDWLDRQFRRVGLEYGPAFRALRGVQRGGEVALGELRAPNEDAAGSLDLAPGLLDGALQSIAALIGERDGLFLPWAIDEVTLIRGLRASGTVHARRAAGDTFDIDVFDDEGIRCAALRGVAVREARDPLGNLFYSLRWVESRRSSDAVGRDGEASRRVLFVESPEALALGDALAEVHAGNIVERLTISDEGELAGLDRSLLDFTTPDRIYFLAGIRRADAGARPAPTNGGVVALHHVFRALAARGAAESGAELVVVTEDVHEVAAVDSLPRGAIPWAATLLGYAKVLAAEYPGLRVISVDTTADDLRSPRVRPLARAIAVEPGNAAGVEVLIRDGRRYERRLERLRVPPPKATPYRERGVYLIVGGAGGLGRALSEHLAQTVRARIAWVGRGVLSREAAAAKQRIEDAGGEVIHVQADATDRRLMASVVAQVKARFGGLNGVVVAAIVLRDKSLANMDDETLLASLAPKLQGSVSVYEAVAGEPLDFLAFFSSAISFRGTAGQANYAAASSFQDAYALRIASRAAFPVHLVNWGYWGAVGIVAADPYRERIEREGILAITPSEGIAAFERILSHRLTRAIPFKARPELLTAFGVDAASEVSVHSESVPRLLEAAVASAASARSSVSEHAGFYEAFGHLEDLAANGARAVLFDVGLLGEAGRAQDFDVWMARANVKREYERLLWAMIDIAERRGWLERRARHLRARAGGGAAAGLAAVVDQAAEIGRAHPQVAGHAALMARCVENLPRVLRREMHPMDVLFPRGETRWVEPVYAGNSVADNHNGLVARAVAAFAEMRLAMDPEAVVRVLEVGAGTGATSAVVLAAIADWAPRVHFAYTDISPRFVELGRKGRGAVYPFAEFRPLDITADVEAQGFERGSFDVVLATNVLHATPNIGETLARIKRLLKRNGCVFINEATRRMDYATLTFGLTDGWWAYDDASARMPHAPLLSAGQWRRALTRQGFRAPVALGFSDVLEADFAQCVIAAESDGWSVSAPAKVDAAQRPAAARRPPAPPPTDERPPRDLLDAAGGWLARTMSEILRIDAAGVDWDTNVGEYGVDSLVTMELNRAFAARIGDVPATLLFERPTVRKAAQYFVQHHAEAIKGLAAAFAPARERPPEAAELAGAETAPRETSSHVHDAADPIAVVGLAGRYPDSDDHRQLWRHLVAGRSCIREVPPERFPVTGFFDPAGKGGRTTYTKWGGFLGDVTRFDPLFFEIAPAEAKRMDPQERLFLETAWAAVEDAGYSAAQLRACTDGNVGVFVGVMNGAYGWLGATAFERGLGDVGYSNYWAIANRVSYVLDLRGPSLAVDTACSSSLSALHLACESIRRGECTAAIAGGVNLVLHPAQLAGLSAMKMLSHGPECRPFADGADGFVAGEGVGAVVLKRLANAIRDRDHVYGIVRGTAINSGGRTSGFTVPNPEAQSAVIRRALEQAGVDPASVTYVEAHGTGTTLGDPIEVSSLAAAYASEAGQHCALGSIKSNIGHLEAAAGIAGLTKILLQLEHRRLVPTLHVGRPNPHLRLAETPFRLAGEGGDWTGRSGEPLRAGLSSFGAGGSNAHAVIEAAPARPRSRPRAEVAHLFVLSAKSRERLTACAVRLAAHLETVDRTSVTLADVAFTLQVGREAMSERIAFVCHGWDELFGTLRSYATPPVAAKVFRGSTKDVSAAVQAIIRGDESKAMFDSLLGARKLDRVAELWVAGGAFEWALLHDGDVRRCPLPGYPFGGKSYSLDVKFENPSGVAPDARQHPLLDGLAWQEAGAPGFAFAKELGADMPLLAGHRVHGTPTLPGTAYLEMAYAAAVRAGFSSAVWLERVTFRRPITLGHVRQHVFVRVWQEGDDARFSIYTRGPAAVSVEHASGSLRTGLGERPPRRHDAEMAGGRIVGGDALYERLAALGLSYDASLRIVRELRRSGDEVVADLAAPEQDTSRSDGYAISPAMSDAALQAIAGFFADVDDSPVLHVVHAIGAVRAFAPVPPAARARVLRVGELSFDVTLEDLRGDTVVELRGVELRSTARRPIASPLPRSSGVDRAALDELGEMFRLLGDFGMRKAFGALERIGALPRGSEWTSVPALGTRAAVAPHGAKLFEALVESAVRRGWLLRESGRIGLGERSDGLNGEPTPEDLTALRRRFPRYGSHLELLERCVDAMPDVLRGRRSYADVLFPGGSSDLVEPMYRGNVLTDFYNDAIASVVIDRLSERRRSRPSDALRVVEVGAGTGATTARVLPAVAALGGPLEYVYTDVSRSLLRVAERDFIPAYPFVRACVLDLERDLADGDLEPGTADVVIGSNVFHATRDVERALRHAAGLLRRGGSLVVNELCAVHDFSTLTFGLTPGWWRYTDGERRLPHSPILSIDGWRAVLRDAGLQAASVITIPGLADDAVPQALFVSQRPVETDAGDLSVVASPPSRTPPWQAPHAVHDVNGRVRQTVCAVLGIDDRELDESVDFTALGLDSIASTEIVDRLKDHFGDLEPTLLFEHPTVKRLVLFLEGQGSPREVPEVVPVRVASELSVDEMNEDALDRALARLLSERDGEATASDRTSRPTVKGA